MPAPPPPPDDLHDQVARRLARNEQRYTSGRHRLVETLVGAGRPLTLPEIAALAPDLAQSSTYRNLEALEQCGVVTRLSVGAEHSHFELAEPLLDHHHHLICTHCGAVADVHVDVELEALVDDHLSAAARAAGFTPAFHSLDLHGRCSNCSSDEAPGGS